MKVAISLQRAESNMWDNPWYCLSPTHSYCLAIRQYGCSLLSLCGQYNFVQIINIHSSEKKI